MLCYVMLCYDSKSEECHHKICKSPKGARGVTNGAKSAKPLQVGRLHYNSNQKETKVV